MLNKLMERRWKEQVVQSRRNGASPRVRSSVWSPDQLSFVSDEDLPGLELGTTGARCCVHSAIISESNHAMREAQGRGSRISGGYI